MTLALRLGRTLDELASTVSASELKLWMEYDRISPIGDIRGDIQTAHIVSSVFRSQGGKLSLEEALLRWGNADDIESESENPSGVEDFFSKLAG